MSKQIISTPNAPAAIGTYSQAVRAGFDHVVKATVYLTDLAHFALVNKVMADYFREPYPARAAVGVAALPRGAQIEVECIVAL
jgi:enamine deaminase RidA (YjgF/YER057c/UK114 family)